MDVPGWATFTGKIYRYEVNYIGYFSEGRYELHGDDGHYDIGNNPYEMNDWRAVGWEITPIEVELENK